MADNGHHPYETTGPPTTHEVQAATEGVITAEVVDNRPQIEFMGEKFFIAAKTGIMPLLKFAAAADKGLDSTDYKGLAALYVMVRDCIDGEAEWLRFEQLAIDSKAEADDVFGVINQTVELLTARPTTPPGTSSAGRQPTLASSKGSSSSPAPEVLAELTSVDSLVGR